VYTDSLIFEPVVCNVLIDYPDLKPRPTIANPKDLELPIQCVLLPI
jgi:hypothetical protein